MVTLEKVLEGELTVAQRNQLTLHDLIALLGAAEAAQNQPGVRGMAERFEPEKPQGKQGISSSGVVLLVGGGLVIGAGLVIGFMQGALLSFPVIGILAVGAAIMSLTYFVENGFKADNLKQVSGLIGSGLVFLSSVAAFVGWGYFDFETEPFVNFVTTLPWEYIGMGAGLLAAVVVGSLYVFGSRRTKEWKESSSAKDLAEIHKAVQSQDVKTLIRLRDQAQGRYQRISKLIGIAQKAGEKVVHNKTTDKLSLAQRYSAYDGFVTSVAKLMLNAVADKTQAGQRPGGFTPEYWNQLLGEKEKEALAKKFEGFLALVLADLSKELAEQEENINEIDKALAEFDKVRPTLFAGEMRVAYQQSQEQFAPLKAEDAQERGYYRTKNDAMRRRVSDNLYSQSSEFKQHRDRFDQLKEFLEKVMNPLVGLADDIQANLEEMVSQRGLETMYDGLAAANTAVPVPKTRSVSDGQGGTTTESYTEIEDQAGRTGPWPP